MIQIQQKQRQTRKGIIIFILTILLSGGALSVTGNMQNPFDALSNVVTFFQTGRANEEKGSLSSINPSFQTNSQGTRSDDRDSSSDADHTPKGGDQGKGGGDTSSPNPVPSGNNSEKGTGEFPGTIQWNRFGEVFFNLWFLAATCAVFILGEHILDLRSKKRQKRRSARV